MDFHREVFLVQLCLMDVEFKKLVDVLELVTINTTEAWEHVQGLKERSGCKRMITVHDHQSTLSRCFPFPAIFMIHQKRGRDELFKKSKTECEEFNSGLACRH
jgi:hypothetical protein